MTFIVDLRMWEKSLSRAATIDSCGNFVMLTCNYGADKASEIRTLLRK